MIVCLFIYLPVSLCIYCTLCYIYILCIRVCQSLLENPLAEPRNVEPRPGIFEAFNTDLWLRSLGVFVYCRVSGSEWTTKNLCLDLVSGWILCP